MPRARDKALQLLMLWFKSSLALALCAMATLSQAEEAQLHIKPARCIALHEGQVCYQKLSISWQVEQADNYCLQQQDNKVLLICWENIASGRWVYEFEGARTQKFILIRKRDDKPMAEFSLEVAWVYDARSHRESHWKIF